MVVSIGWFNIFTWEMVGNHQTSIFKWLFRVPGMNFYEENPINLLGQWLNGLNFLGWRIWRMFSRENKPFKRLFFSGSRTAEWVNLHYPLLQAVKAKPRKFPPRIGRLIVGSSWHGVDWGWCLGCLKLLNGLQWKKWLPWLVRLFFGGWNTT